MDQFFTFPSSMLWPLAACLVLTGIHVYLGVHVIARKVIFVDLALAQIAALGTVTGVLLGYEVGKDLTSLYLYSLAFTIFGAFIFSATRMKGEKVPHEAIIGIIYAVTFAATILVLSKSALGPQELDHIIKGELLWVQGPTVIKTAIIYACVGLFHFIFRKNFMAISFDPARAEQEGINVRLWDFLFYTSFGFVITSSVAIAGVFLVFSYLVIPSVGAMLLSDKLGKRLAIGWIGGSLISFIGVKMSYSTGLPTSPLVVVIFAVALIISGIIRYIRHAPRILVAMRNMAAAVLIGALFIAGIFFFRKAEEDPLEHVLHLLASPLSTDRTAALIDLKRFPEAKNQWLTPALERLGDDDAEVRREALALMVSVQDTAALDRILPLLSDKSDEVRKSAIRTVESLDIARASRALLAGAEREDDPELKLQFLEGAIHLGDPGAVPPLIGLLEEGGVFADDAYGILRSHTQCEFARSEIGKISSWWNAKKGKVSWDKSARMFK